MTDLKIPESLPEKLDKDEWIRFVMGAQQKARSLEERTIDMCRGRWELGKYILDWCEEQPGGRSAWYGKEMRVELGKEIGMGVKTISHCVSVARHLRTEESVEELFDRIRESRPDGKVTWEYFRSLGTPPSSRDPDQHGGHELQAHDILQKFQAIVGEVQDYTLNGMSEEYESQVQGAITKALEILVELSRFLDTTGIERAKFRGRMSTDVEYERQPP